MLTRLLVAPCRVVLCGRWVNQRKAFGRPLHSLAVIRSKLAGMISRVESLQSWLESVTYQMCNMVRSSHSL